MEFKFASSILFSNMGYVLKLFFWLLLSALLVAAAGAAIIIPIFNALSARADIIAAVTAIKDALDGFVNLELNVRHAFAIASDNAVILFETVASDTGAVVGLVFSSLFLYLLYSFLSGLSYYSMADIINNIMSSNLRFGLMSNIALNFKKCVRYSAARMLICLPLDILIWGVLLGLAVGLFSIIKLAALPLLLIFAVLFYSLRAMLFSGWLPRLIYHPEEPVYTAFSKSFTFVKTNFKGFFKAFVLTFAISYMLVAVFTLPTFGLIAILMPAIYKMLIRTVELIGYYKVKGLCFYTDATTVINTVEYGYRSDNQSNADDEADFDGESGDAFVNTAENGNRSDKDIRPDADEGFGGGDAEPKTQTKTTNNPTEQ
jgi:hypothetical protein